MLNYTNLQSLHSDRIFYLSEDVSENSMGNICFELLKFINFDIEEDKIKKNYYKKPIKIFINSFGGSVYDCWSLIDIIEHSTTPIYTYVTGKAMSCGFLIFLAGHKRFATEHATLLCHDVSWSMSGKYEIVKNNVDELHRLKKDIEEYILSKTNIPKQDIYYWNERAKDWYIHSEDFERLGICKVIKDKKDIFLEE